MQKTDSAIYIHDDHLYLERVAALTTISFKENGYQSCHVTKIKRVIHGWKWFVKTLNTDIKRLVYFFFHSTKLIWLSFKTIDAFGHLAINNCYLLFLTKKTTGGLNCYISHLFITMKNYYYFLNIFSLKAYLNVHHSQFILCHWKNSITTLTNVFI